MAIKKISARPWLLLTPSLSVVTLLLAVPVGFVVAYSFWQRTITGLEVPDLHVGNWTEFFGDYFYHYILWQTLRYAGRQLDRVLRRLLLPLHPVADPALRGDHHGAVRDPRLCAGVFPVEHEIQKQGAAGPAAAAAVLGQLHHPHAVVDSHSRHQRRG